MCKKYVLLCMTYWSGFHLSKNCIELNPEGYSPCYLTLDPEILVSAKQAISLLG